MGKTPTEIEFDVERQRHALTARVARLKRRVGEDVDTTRSRTSGHVSGVKHSVLSGGEQAATRVGNLVATTAGSGTAVAEHPKSLVAGAAAGGFAFGLIAGADGEPRASKHTSGSKESGLRRALMDGARGLVASKAADGVGAVVDSAKGSIKSAFFGREGSAPDQSRESETSPVNVARPPQLGRGEPGLGATDRPVGETSGAALDPFTA
ncbi:MAG: hypothetical protein ABI939_00860 [Anaerolineaceae bacterium]